MTENIERSQLRSSCDQCRSKKAKCDGEYPACARCIRVGEDCSYSSKRPMGRPKKRRLQGDHESQDLATVSPPLSTSRDQESDSGRENEVVCNASGENYDPRLFDSYTNTATDASWRCESGPLNESIFTSSLDQDVSQESCACLATMYLCMDEMRRAGNLTFPSGLTVLQDATAKATDILGCSICPNNLVWAMQNAQVLNTLLMSLAEGYARVHKFIDKEAIRAEEANETKDMWFSETHPGDPASPNSTFLVSLNPLEWKKLARKTLRDQMKGTPGRQETSFGAVVDMMEARQLRWHSNMHPSNFTNGGNDRPEGQQPMCVLWVRQARCLTDQLQFDD